MICKDFFDHVKPMMNYSLIQKTWLRTNCEPICKKYKLKMSEYQILLLIHVNSDVQTAKDIEKFSEMKRANISILVEILCKKGFLIQEAIENDRRMKKLTLTKECDELIHDTDKIIDYLVINTFKDIDNEDLAICEKVFNKMYENLIETTSKNEGK